MKKNLALFLATIMIFGCMLGLAPAADASLAVTDTVECYEPTITYSNVNYTEDIVLMFAVPAPAAGSVEEGSSVKVIVWDTPSAAYRYKEALTNEAHTARAVELKAEESRVTIGGVEHLVYKYDKLDASKMTDVVYARAVVVDKDGEATAYSDVLDYSIVEYVETAKGGFSTYGAPTVSEDVLELLDSLLVFGSVVQEIAGDGNTYAPNGYLANDELHKIWITPVVAGKTLDRVFGGFFKYEEGGVANVYAPFFDGFEVVAYKDALGNKLEDANTVGYDDAEGFQINAVDADIEITAEYDTVAFKEILTATALGENFVINNIEEGPRGDIDIINKIPVTYSNPFTQIKIGTIVRRLNFSGEACVPKEKNGNTYLNYYHGWRTVPNTDNSGNLAFLITVTNEQPVVSFAYIDAEELKNSGYGDTVGEALTFEFEVGKPHKDAVVNTLGFSLKRDYRQNAFPEGYEATDEIFELFRIKDNKVYILNGASNDTDNGAEVCELPDTGLVKVAVTVFDTGVIKGYYRDENGEMVEACELNLVMTDTFLSNQAKHQANLADENDENNNDLIAFESFANWLSMSRLSPNWYFGYGSDPNANIENATVMINGVETPVKNSDGTFNRMAVRAYAEENYSFLLDNFKFCVGAIYDFESGEEENEKLIKSMTGEDFGEGFAFSNLTDKIGVYDGYPAVISAIGATHGAESDTALNGYRFEKLFRRVWFDGNIGGTKFFQGIKTVADPSNPQNLVLQITSANRNTLDLETIKPEELAKADWGNGGAITIGFELGKPTPNADVTTLPFQLHRRTDENPDAGLSGNKTITVFTIKNNKVYLCKFGANAADETKLICEIPDTGFVKFAIEINDNGLIKAYSQDESGAMVCVCELNVSTHTALGTEDFASWMNYVITPRWGVGENSDAATIQAATVEIDGAQVPVYADGAYNEAALQLYMEQNHSFLLDNYKIVAGAIYE